MTDEFYVLKEEVINPKPDRRSKSPTAQPLWPVGTVIRVKQFNDPDSGKGGYIEFVFSPNGARGYGTLPLWEEGAIALLSAQKAPAPTTLYVLEAKYGLGPAYWLAALVEIDDWVTIDKVEEVARHIAQAEEGSEEDKRQTGWFKKHGL